MCNAIDENDALTLLVHKDFWGTLFFRQKSLTHGVET
jgi:hypothetical protein